MKFQRLIVYCEPCGFKKIIDNEESQLKEIPTSSIQTNIPQLDMATNKTIPSKFKPQSKKFKCPNCGRGVTAKALPNSYAKAIGEKEEEATKRAEREGMIQDGWVPTPIADQAKTIIQEARRKSYEKDHGS
jgi:predicted RNA-binding Zn-ribbon protein involved in translation (DUF1610 family)